jgi:hypothetical protein
MKRLVQLGALGVFCLAMTGQTTGDSGYSIGATADIARKGYACGRAKGMAEGFGEGTLRGIAALKIWEEAGCGDFEELFKPVASMLTTFIPYETVSITPTYQVEGRQLHWFGGKPLNNQCPACGEMAKRYKWLPPCGAYVLPNGMLSSDNGAHLPLKDCSLGEPQRNLTRCKRCNAAFWQDAEAGK